MRGKLLTCAALMLGAGWVLAQSATKPGAAAPATSMQADANLVFNQSLSLAASCAVFTLALGFFAGPYYVRTLGASAATVAAGIIERGLNVGRATDAATKLGRSSKEERLLRFGHPSAAVWVQGRPHVAQLVERQLFDEGWHVQLAGPNDFLAHELVTVAKAYKLSGLITIFCPLDDGTEQKRVVRAIYGPESFFAVKIDNDTDDQATDRIVNVLRKWRDKQSDAQKDKQ